MKKLTIFKELTNSYKECLKRKASTTNAMKFAIEKDRNLMKLKLAIENREYIPGQSIYFLVAEPKIREVFAAGFGDRVIHHFFIRAIEKAFCDDITSSVYSCIKNRGAHNCISDIGNIYKNYKYYLQIDIRSFFMSIDKKILKEKIRKYLFLNVGKNPKGDIYDYSIDVYYYLLDVLLDFNPTTNCKFKEKKWNKGIIYDQQEGYKLGEKLVLPKHKSLFGCKDGIGMPIGNYTSQFFANVYLNDLDKYILNDLGVKNYFRYVDDLVLFGNDYKELKSFVEKIQNYLETNLNMTLATEKIKLKQTLHGLDFLGYFIKPNVLYTRKRVKKAFAVKLKTILPCIIKYNEERKIKIVSLQRENIAKLESTCASYIGHFSHASAKHLQKKIFYKFSFLQHYFNKKWKIYDYLKTKKVDDREKTKRTNIWRRPGIEEFIMFKQSGNLDFVYDKFKVKTKPEKNTFTSEYIAYKYYTKTFPGVTVFFPTKGKFNLEMEEMEYYYIFRKSDIEILKQIPKSEIVKYLGAIKENIGFKVNSEKAKGFLQLLLQYTNKNILLLERTDNKIRPKYLYLQKS